jgi:serine/threonine-protein kinase
MGEVWSARHRMLARMSAVKLIRPEGLVPEAGNGQLLLRRFEREARATAALRSPHTVALYDYGATEEGSFYFAMELLDGLDLENLVLRFGPLSAGRTVWLLSQAARSLDEAHEMGIVHRDIKPRNIFTCRAGTEYDFVKVLDFGLVKMNCIEDTQTCLTREGVATGTPAYMAPEIATGRPDIDGRADLYGLGCVGYWLLTGQLVFEAPTAMAMALAHVRDRPLPPSSRTEILVPPSLDRLILRCLEKDPAARPESARKLLDLLEDCEGVEPWSQKQAEAWWCTNLPCTNAPARPSVPGGGHRPEPERHVSP